MSLSFLTQVGGLLKPFAWVLGMILNAIYKFSALIGIENIAFCIVVFTIVVKMLMLPLTIKQQRFAKVSAMMNPELRALNEKYRGVDRSDRAAMQRYTQEQQALYQKYGSSPFGGCLPLIITLFVFFALYRVIYAIPAYVTDVGDQYRNVAQSVFNIGKSDDNNISESDVTDALKEFCDEYKVSARNSKNSGTNYNITDMIDIFSVYNTDVWANFRSAELFEEKVDDDGNVIESKWNKLAGSALFKDAMAAQSDSIDKILHVNSLGKYNILDAPGYHFPAILLPILAFVLQFITGRISTAQTKTKNKEGKEEAAMPGMGMMNTIFPVLSGVFCVFMPIGVGIYWVVNSGVTIVQQLAINKYLAKYDIEDIVAKNEAKAAERVEKMGFYAKDGGVSNIAKSSTKSIATIDTSRDSGKNNDRNKNSGKRSESGKVSQKKKDELAKQAAEKGSVGIAAIANIMKNDDEEQ